MIIGSHTNAFINDKEKKSVDILFGYCKSLEENMQPHPYKASQDPDQSAKPYKNQNNESTISSKRRLGSSLIYSYLGIKFIEFIRLTSE